MTSSPPTPAAGILVLAAHPVELAHLRARFAASNSVGVATEVVGVGLAAAGAGTVRALTTRRPAAAILVGSAGHYPGANITQGSLVVASDLHLMDAAVVEGRAALPEPMLAAPPVDVALAEGLLTAPPTAIAASVATTLSITTDDRLASALGGARLGEVENLEAHAVAGACHAARVPFAALLGITNEVGSQGRNQWLANHRAVGQQVAEKLLSWLALGNTDPQA